VVIRAFEDGTEKKCRLLPSSPDRRDYRGRGKQGAVAAAFISWSDGYRSSNYSVRKASMGSVFAALRAGITAATNAAAARTAVVINRTKGS
jgi:hypothetical protein